VSRRLVVSACRYRILRPRVMTISQVVLKYQLVQIVVDSGKLGGGCQRRRMVVESVNFVGRSLPELRVCAHIRGETIILGTEKPTLTTPSIRSSEGVIDLEIILSARFTTFMEIMTTSFTKLHSLLYPPGLLAASIAMSLVIGPIVNILSALLLVVLCCRRYGFDVSVHVSSANIIHITITSRVLFALSTRPLRAPLGPMLRCSVPAFFVLPSSSVCHVAWAPSSVCSSAPNLSTSAILHTTNFPPPHISRHHNPPQPLHDLPFPPNLSADYIILGPNIIPQ